MSSVVQIDQRTRAIIIGGGIAGPATAMALQRVGIDAVVYEAHPPVAEDVGSYFTITTNGIYALRALGLDDIAVEIGFPARQTVLLNDRGQRLAAVPFGRALPDGTVSQTIKRTRLSRALVDEAIRRGVTVEFGKRLIDASTTANGGVTARFEDGSEAAGDLLVGADGVHSVIRRLIDPDAPAPRYVGLVNFGGYTAGVQVPGEPESWHMIFGRRAFFGYQVDPRGGVVWFANVPRERVSAAELAATSIATWQEHLAELFADDRGPAVELIRHGKIELAADNTHDLPRVQRWHAGAMVILGDAAHAPSPSSGQGASMAIEDAVAERLARFSSWSSPLLESQVTGR